MKTYKLLLLSSLMALTASADTIEVNKLRIAGPFTTSSPIATDTADVDGKSFNADTYLEQSVNLQAWKSGQESSELIFPAQPSRSMYLAGFTIQNNRFVKGSVAVSNAKSATVFVDGQQTTGLKLAPGSHDVVLRLLTTAGQADTIKVCIQSDHADYISVNPEGKRMYALSDYMNGPHARRTALSYSGRFMHFNSSLTRKDKQTTYKEEIIDLKTGNVLAVNDFMAWSSVSDNYIRRQRGSQLEYVYELVDPLTGKTLPLATDYAGNEGYFLHGDRLMLISKQTDGPKEDPQVSQILFPDDRQPGWRNRSNVQLWDASTQQLQTLTQGQHNTWAVASDDNSKFLVFVSHNDITRRPFSFTTVLLYDRSTQQTDTLVREDGFISSGQFSPDGRYVVFQGSPEAFGGIGINDKTGKIPSIIQNELFRMDLTTKQVESLTFDFNPNVSSWQWSRADGNIYALCENHDRMDIFRINPSNKKYARLPLSECYVFSFSLADNKPLLSYTGQSDSNSDRVYTFDLKSGRETLIRDYDKQRMGDISLGTCQDWNFKAERGDTIYGRFYLPPNFDASKKYPMLVYYYGGCSPTGRYLDSYYNFHGWAAMGYVVYVIQPSGCTGFGQEFAARHVNAYGDYTADDIIQGTRTFCLEHPYVNDKKIGCLGASYGGFMTQYLTTKTDLFAAAMSHAGISNPASYWGYGYWGYSYSATSAAHSYPWNNKDLYTDHAPLFNADKVHTPILFLHGTADTNVPINESIQMFTALKILGRPTAFVTVDGQNHHITDYDKRIKWIHTYYAWFAKWLQDDPTWWNELYPEKNLK